MIKTLSILGIKGNFLNLMKGIDKKPTVNGTVLFSPKLMNKVRMSNFTTSIQHHTSILGSAMTEEKEIGST